MAYQLKQSGDEIQKILDKYQNGFGSGEPGKSPYIGDNGNWFQWNSKTSQYEDSGVQAQGERGQSGLPKIVEEIADNFHPEASLPLPAYSEVHITDIANSLFDVSQFKRNIEYPGNDMWAIRLTVGEGFSLYASAADPVLIEWAVAEPVFTPGYTYYLSFIPLVDESADEDVLFSGTVLGVWVAKELKQDEQTAV